MKIIVTIAAGLLLTACATTADTGAAATETADASDRICTRESPTGTRIPGRTICRTQAEWDAIQERSQDTVREMQRTRQDLDNPQ